MPPLFVKKLSVGDVITVRARLERVSPWKHVRRSLAELARGATREINGALKRLRAPGCSTSTSKSLGVYAIDVPPEMAIRSVDAVLAALDPAKVAIAYPSFRHRE